MPFPANASIMASAISVPRSSWRKWAAPSIRTCSPAVDSSSVKRSPARGKGNTGSVSENATSAGLSQPARASLTATISAAPVSSGVSGTSSGKRCAPALLSGFGYGAS